jgi:hypothetical protein
MTRVLATILLILAALAVPVAAQIYRPVGVLVVLRAANMNSTADQAINFPPQITTVVLYKIIFANCSGTPNTAAGAIYTGAGKSGAVYSASTTYATLTSAQAQKQIVTVFNTQLVSPWYFSLTTPQGTAMTCDIYIVGFDLT